MEMREESEFVRVRFSKGWVVFSQHDAAGPPLREVHRGDEMYDKRIVGACATALLAPRPRRPVLPLHVPPAVHMCAGRPPARGAWYLCMCCCRTRPPATPACGCSYRVLEPGPLIVRTERGSEDARHDRGAAIPIAMPPFPSPGLVCSLLSGL